jgi:preprotein translocase subunit SecD
VQKQRVILGLIIVPVIAMVGSIVNNIGVISSAVALVDDRNVPANNPEKTRFDVTGGLQLTIQLKPTKKHPIISKSDLDDVQKVFKDRLDSLGVSAATIQSAGNDRILVQLTGIKDSFQVEKVISSTSQLEFREQKMGTAEKLSAEMATLQAARRQQVALKKSQNRQAIANNQVTIQQQLTKINKLFKVATIDGKNIKKTFPQPVSSGAWEIGVVFDNAGSKAFEKMTKDLAGTGRSIGIFLDNDLVSNPTVSVQFATTGITGGVAVIVGNFTEEDARNLAIQLSNGSLPVPVEIIENRIIPPK